MTSLGKRKLSMMPTTRGKYKLKQTMKPLSETYKELGIAFTFPIEIEDANGNDTYFENSDGFWCKWEYDTNGNETYYENIYPYWCKREYDTNGNETYYENSDGLKNGTPREPVLRW